MDSPAEKICSCCKLVKPVDDFALHPAGKLGRRAKCRSCANVTRMAWVDQNRGRVRSNGRAVAAALRSTEAGAEKHRAASRQYYEKNRESAKASASRYRGANRAKFNAAIAEWRQVNRDRQRAMNATWNFANPEKRRIYALNRRARKVAAGGTLSPDLAEKLFVLQKGMCPCCNLPLGDDFHLDHRMPLALGGPNIDSNMQLLRAKCNLQKNASHPVDFMQSRGFLI